MWIWRVFFFDSGSMQLCLAIPFIHWQHSITMLSLIIGEIPNWEKKQQQPAELNWLGIVNKISLFTQTFRCVTNSVKIETNLSALILSFFNVIDKDRHIERSEEKQQRWCLRCKNMRVNWMLSRVPFQIGNFVTFWRNRSHKIGVTWRKAHAALTGSIGWIR